MEVLHHLPATRAIANATQWFGPTKEDIHKIKGYLTKLFADTVSWTHDLDYFMNDVRRSEKHDLEFQRMIFADQCATEVTALPAMHGMLTGIWEGYYMVSSIGSHSSGTLLTGAVYWGCRWKHPAPSGGHTTTFHS